MDFRPDALKRHDLKKKCYDLVTGDRVTFWEFTIERFRQRKIDLGGVLRVAMYRSKA
ncbi:hypothetical protein D3C85_273260 [compost metagenome]